MIEAWKVPHIVKGMLTWIPAVDAWRLRRIRASASDSPRYCYAVWFRHLVTLQKYGFDATKAKVGELGPGESLGVGLAALLCGARSYTGLDVTPFAKKTNLEQIFDDLAQMLVHKEPIPNEVEFPHLFPKLDAYEFPTPLVLWDGLSDRSKKIKDEIALGPNQGELVNYHAPWNSLHDVPEASLDLILSQAVLEHVNNLEEAYVAMFKWLKSGGYASHVIDFSSHHLSSRWNGHWSYSDWEWGLVKGRRQILLNRAPLSTHLAYAKRVGFEVVSIKSEEDHNGFDISTLSRQFATLNVEDARTRAAMVILRKP